MSVTINPRQLDVTLPNISTRLEPGVSKVFIVNFVGSLLKILQIVPENRQKRRLASKYSKIIYFN